MADLKIIDFNLKKTCPAFVREYRPYDVPFDQQMRNLGFKSAKYNSETHHHSLIENEFTLFLLRYK